MGAQMDWTVKDSLGLAVGVVLAFFVFGNIFSKAGYPRWYGLLMAVPFLNVVVLVWFAYCDWPIEDKVLELEFSSSRQSSGTTAG
jgi:uncharacterized membrane protein YhdT